MGTHPIFESDFDCLTDMSQSDFIRTCNGRTVDKTKEILEVHIEKGMDDGGKIHFSGKNEEEPIELSTGMFLVSRRRQICVQMATKSLFQS